jgi:hypothetical protein
VDGVELVAVVADELQGVALVKLKWVVRLRGEVDAHDLEAGLAVAHSGATGAAKRI